MMCVLLWTEMLVFLNFGSTWLGWFILVGWGSDFFRAKKFKAGLSFDCVNSKETKGKFKKKWD